MKAAVCYKYGAPGDVIKIKEVEKPNPKEGEVLIKIHAASVNAADWHGVRGTPFFTRVITGLLKPRNKIPGGDLSGVVEAAGPGTKQFKPGDEVAGCLIDSGAGCFAEYVCAKESLLAPKLPCISFEEAAALPMAAVTALQGLRDSGQIKSGHKVLINGASGGVGTFAVQIAKAFGAEVTAVCSTKALDTVSSLGADDVVDYTKEDFMKNGKRYDLIFDIAATHTANEYRNSLTETGTCVLVSFAGTPRIGHMLKLRLSRKKDGKKIVMMMAKNTSRSDLIFLNELVEAGKLRAVIDSRYTLDEIAAAASHVENDHPVGKVVIKVSDEANLK